MQVDDSKLAQTERLITEIKKKLDTAQKVMAYEGKFEEPMQVDASSEQEVMSKAQDYLATAKK